MNEWPEVNEGLCVGGSLNGQTRVVRGRSFAIPVCPPERAVFRPLDDMETPPSNYTIGRYDWLPDRGVWRYADPDHGLKAPR